MGERPGAAGAPTPTTGRGDPVGAGPVGSGPVGALRGLLQRPLASYYLLLATVGLLVLIGLVMVASATSLSDYAENQNSFLSVQQQGIWAVLGLVGFWFCQRLPVRTFRGVAKPALVLAFILMAIVDLLGFATSLRTPPGADPNPLRLGPIYATELWLHVGPVQLQPAEIAKLGLVLWGADVLTRKGPRAARWRELMTPLFPAAIALFLLVGFNDLGSMLCLVILFVGLLWTAGVRLRVFGAMITAGLLGIAGLTLMPGKSEYRSSRIEVFLDPQHADPDKGGYQFFQGLYAIANGGWVGVGLGEGHLKWGRLPNGHNDFIFALIAEELGVVGCVVVIALFAVLTFTGLRIARRVADPYRRLVAAAITFWFVGQAAINIGGVLGLMPITGLPLPFISDGGTALVAALAGVGILTSFARAEPDAARALHARPPRRWVRLLWAPLPPLPPSDDERRRPAKTGGRPRPAGTGVRKPVDAGARKLVDAGERQPVRAGGRQPAPAARSPRPRRASGTGGQPGIGRDR